MSLYFQMTLSLPSTSCLLKLPTVKLQTLISAVPRAPHMLSNLVATQVPHVFFSYIFSCFSCFCLFFFCFFFSVFFFVFVCFFFSFCTLRACLSLLSSARPGRAYVRVPRSFVHIFLCVRRHLKSDVFVDDSCVVFR